MLTPLSSTDLRAIADALESIEFAEPLVNNPLFGKIEVYRPDSDTKEIVGHFVPVNSGEDSWYGFELPSPFGTLQ